MGRGFDNPEVAARAGSKSKPGKHEKTKKIEALLDSLSGEHSERFNRILNEMADEPFAQFYKDLIKYVAPVKTHNINENAGDVRIVFENTSEQFDVDEDGNVTEK